MYRKRVMWLEQVVERANQLHRRDRCHSLGWEFPAPSSGSPLQLAVLNNSAGEDLGDQDALEAELERELAAAEAAEAEGAPTPQGKKVRIICA